jgi:hypothetical protein
VIYLFFRENYRGYSYSGRHNLEKYRVGITTNKNLPEFTQKNCYDHRTNKTADSFKFLFRGSNYFDLSSSRQDDMYFHLTFQGNPVIRQAKKVEILLQNSLKPAVSINCEEALISGKDGRVFEKAELIKSQIDMIVSKNLLQFAASKGSKNRMF